MMIRSSLPISYIINESYDSEHESFARCSTGPDSGFKRGVKFIYKEQLNYGDKKRIKKLNEVLNPLNAGLLITSYPKEGTHRVWGEYLPDAWYDVVFVQDTVLDIL